MRPYLEMFERLTPDSVLVSTTPGGKVGHFGELTANAARAHGCVGMILDGNLRDIEGLRAIGFPVFYRDLSPLNGIGRWEMTASQQPVAIGGVTVNPGDIVFAEFDGVLVVPRADAADRARAGRGDRRAARDACATRCRAGARPGRASSGMATSRAERARRSRARALDARRSAIREVFDAANRMPDAIRLEIGEPSFRTPRFVVDAAFEAAAAGQTGYTPNGGYASLREALAEKIERVDGFAVDPDAVVVTPGAMNALFSIYLALLEPGDEVLLPTPGFPNMDEMVRLLGGEPVFYRLERESGYLPSREELEPLVTTRTKAIFANTPGNPTGAVFPADTVRGLAELAAERGVWLISDEVYDELILDDLPHVSAAALVPDAPVVSVYSFSKVYAMTGWRLGYCAAPPQLADVLRKLQEPQVSCPSAISHLRAVVVRRRRHVAERADRRADARRHRTSVCSGTADGCAVRPAAHHVDVRHGHQRRSHHVHSSPSASGRWSRYPDRSCPRLPGTSPTQPVVDTWSG